MEDQNVIITWQGWAQDVPKQVKNPHIPDDGYIVLFNTGDVVVMQSEKKMTLEEQLPIEKILMHILNDRSDQSVPE